MRAMRSWFGALIVAVLLGGTSSAQERVLVLEGGTLIDGTGGPLSPTRSLSSTVAGSPP